MRRVVTGRSVEKAGRLRTDVFARGTNDAVYVAWQTSPGGSWAGWSNLGGTVVADPAVVVTADGRLAVFDRGTDDSLWYAWQVTAGRSWSGWRGSDA
jgi:hypothetical protein